MPKPVGDGERLAALSPRVPFWRPGVTLRVQSVLFNNEARDVERAVAATARSAELAIRSGACAAVSIRYGDSSSMPCLDEDALAHLRAAHPELLSIDYDHFMGNLGSARGHNRLASDSGADFILVQNPDVVLSPHAIEILLTTFRRAGVGMVEAKQIPIEHPKDYNRVTGETSWATTACSMIPLPLFRQLGEFDADTFFLYCDDVDFSWAVRLAGFFVIFQPAAIAFHDKRLSADAQWQPSAAERYYSAESALFMAHKWSRPDLVETYLRMFSSSGVEDHEKAARTFERRRAEGKLPAQRDPDHKVAQFVDTFYAKHRYPL